MILCEQIFAHNEFAHCEQIFLAILCCCEQCFCRHQQQDSHAGQSSFEQVRHGTEIVSPQAGAYSILPHSQFTTYCRTFLVVTCCDVIYDITMGY
jgi:hypothetical protein